MRVCYHCGTALDDKAEVHRSTVCESCKKDLRVCRNCAFYSPGSHWDCAETVAEPVYDKERSNFCEYFRFRRGPRQESGRAPADDARKRLDRLFGE